MRSLKLLSLLLVESCAASASSATPAPASTRSADSHALTPRALRPADARELSVFLNAHYASSGGLEAHYPAELVRWLLSEAIVAALSDDGGALAGCVVAVPAPLASAPRAVEVTLLCVRSDLRRRGVASRLLAQLRAHPDAGNRPTALYTSAGRVDPRTHLLSATWYHRPLRMHRLVAAGLLDTASAASMEDRARLPRRPPRLSPVRSVTDEVACAAMLRRVGGVLTVAPTERHFRHRYCSAPGAHALILRDRRSKPRGFVAFQLQQLRSITRRSPRAVQALLTAFAIAEGEPDEAADELLCGALACAHARGAHVLNALPLGLLSAAGRLEAAGFGVGDGTIHVHAEGLHGAHQAVDPSKTTWLPVVF